jgi:glycosyltransferase involved in cell wall biosynthesis
VVVPLRFGSGVRNKILEAWCLQKCVVTTTMGAEGLDYEDGKHLAIADDAARMAATVTRALRDPEFRDRLRLAGRAVATERHHPGRVAAVYHQAIHETAREKASRHGPMRVAVDLRWLVPGVAGGIENVARSFLGQLLGLDRHNAYTLLLHRFSRLDFDLRRNPNVRTVCFNSPAALLKRLLRDLAARVTAGLGIHPWRLPTVLDLEFIRSLDAEIAYSFPGYIQPSLFPLRHVLMVPDVQHEFHPEFFTEAHVEERRRLYTDSIHRAEHVCAISEFTRQSLIERLGVAPEKVTTIPLAADAIFTAEPGPAEASRLHHYGLRPGSYLFFPAHTWHHKNHRAAVAALEVLRRRHGLSPLLVCSGGVCEAQPVLERQIAEAGLGGQVRFLGYCPRSDIPVLYRNALALVFPSVFEGFGMPVLEAMGCRCPVVCSNTTSLPEIAGDAALQVAPADVEGLADAVAALARQPDLRAELAARGLRQAAGFSWRRHTLDTIAVFYKVHQKFMALGDTTHATSAHLHRDRLLQPGGVHRPDDRVAA